MGEWRFGLTRPAICGGGGGGPTGSFFGLRHAVSAAELTQAYIAANEPPV